MKAVIKTLSITQSPDQSWSGVVEELNFDGEAKSRAYDYDSTAMLAVSGFMESIEMGSDPEDAFNRNMKDILLHV
jgi:hypothetical protein